MLGSIMPCKAGSGRHQGLQTNIGAALVQRYARILSADGGAGHSQCARIAKLVFGPLRQVHGEHIVWKEFLDGAQQAVQVDHGND